MNQITGGRAGKRNKRRSQRKGEGRTVSSQQRGGRDEGSALKELSREVSIVVLVGNRYAGAVLVGRHVLHAVVRLLLRQRLKAFRHKTQYM